VEPQAGADGDGAPDAGGEGGDVTGQRSPHPGVRSGVGSVSGRPEVIVVKVQPLLSHSAPPVEIQCLSRDIVVATQRPRT
jgi:hypothetical protein